MTVRGDLILDKESHGGTPAEYRKPDLSKAVENYQIK